MELVQYKEMREAIVRVRELHWKTRNGHCAHCSMPVYPCPTIKALDGEQ